ncbi:DUF3114 domain-containing protein [Streptococcus sp. FT1-55]|uniref:DUF3114 domain-containing protein n=1 Tax=Streptococcus sp. FT1-55 TaxID=3409805 RepID=UPI003BF4C177
MTHLFLDNSFIKIKFMKSYRIVFANLIFGLAFFFCTNALAEQKKPASKLETYVSQLKQPLSTSEQQQLVRQLETDVNALKSFGWSEKSIQKVYLKAPSKKKNVSQLKVLFTKRSDQAKLFGSDIFQQMWEYDVKGASQSKAKKLLKLALEAVGMPDEISGSPQETAELISHFSDDIEPNENFCKIFSRTVQLAFPGRSLAKPGNLQHRLHQLRYVISAQQAQWVRKEYRSPGLTDAQALARYMKDMDESNAFIEGVGIKDDRYYYNYDWGESSRLHNKIAISNQAISKIKKTYPDGKNQVNFKIYNYANENNKMHRYLDVYPVLLHAPQFRKGVLQKHGVAFKSPNKVKSRGLADRRTRWEYSYYNKKGYYGSVGLSRAQRVAKAVKAFK